MGIRIHKAMGWGLVRDNKTFKEIFQEFDLYSTPQQSYQDFLVKRYGVADEDSFDVPTEEHFSNDLIHLQGEKKDSPYYGYNFVSYSQEFNDTEQALVVTPLLTLNEWVRSDDGIDYAEAEYAYKDEPVFELDNTVKYLPYNQFPYSGMYMDSVTGESLSDLAYRKFKTFRLLKEDEKSAAQLDNEVIEQFFQDNGFESYEDAVNRIVPLVPQEVRDVCDWLGLFRNPTDVTLLRPIILTYWE